MLGWPRTPSPSQYEMPSPLSLLCPARALLPKDEFRWSLRAETLEFVAQPAKQMAQTTRTLLKRSVKAFQCFLYIALYSRSQPPRVSTFRSHLLRSVIRPRQFSNMFPQPIVTFLQSSPFIFLNELFPRNSRITECPTQKFPMTAS